MLTRSSRLSVRKLRLYKHRSWRAGAAPRSLAGRADERRQLVALFTPYAKITFGKKMLGGALPPRRPVTAWPKERYLAATPWPLAHQASLSAEPYHAVVTCARFGSSVVCMALGLVRVERTRLSSHTPLAPARPSSVEPQPASLPQA